MAKYTICLKEVIKNNNIFPTNYNYYEPSLQEIFEKRFIEHYYYSEIGFESIGMFKRKLRSKLMDIMPMINKLYETELHSKKFDFLLNKDLKETFIREVITEGNTSSTNENNGTSSNTSNVKTNGENNSNYSNKESNYNDGVASLEKPTNLAEGSNSDNNNLNSNSSNDGKSSSSNKYESNSKNSNKEKTELEAKGNIGTTSTGQLVESWRNILIDLDEQIIDKCNDLFMLIY